MKRITLLAIGLLISAGSFSQTPLVYHGTIADNSPENRVVIAADITPLRINFGNPDVGASYGLGLWGKVMSYGLIETGFYKGYAYININSPSDNETNGNPVSSNKFSSSFFNVTITPFKFFASKDAIGMKKENAILHVDGVKRMRQPGLRLGFSSISSLGTLPDNITATRVSGTGDASYTLPYQDVTANYHANMVNLGVAWVKTTDLAISVKEKNGEVSKGRDVIEWYFDLLFGSNVQFDNLQVVLPANSTTNNTSVAGIYDIQDNNKISKTGFRFGVAYHSYKTFLGNYSTKLEFARAPYMLHDVGMLRLDFAWSINYSFLTQ